MSADRITHAGLTFAVAIEPDHHHGEPWKEFDDHGTVSEWTRRDKRPGERILYWDAPYAHHRYYDVAESMRTAKRDGWGLGPEALAKLATRLGRTPTPGDIAAAAVEDDYQRLRAWCENRWQYVGVVVILLDVEGDATRQRASLWGIESDAGAYLDEVAQELAAEIAREIGARRKFIEQGARRIRVRT